MISIRFTSEQVKKMVESEALKEMDGFRVISVSPMFTRAESKMDVVDGKSGHESLVEFLGFECLVEKKRRYHRKAITVAGGRKDKQHEKGHQNED